jgi:hypothetical protein
LFASAIISFQPPAIELTRAIARRAAASACFDVAHEPRRCRYAHMRADAWRFERDAEACRRDAFMRALFSRSRHATLLSMPAITSLRHTLHASAISMPMPLLTERHAAAIFAFRHFLHYFSPRFDMP